MTFLDANSSITDTNTELTLPFTVSVSLLNSQAHIRSLLRWFGRWLLVISWKAGTERPVCVALHDRPGVDSITRRVCMAAHPCKSVCASWLPVSCVCIWITKARGAGMKIEKCLSVSLSRLYVYTHFLLNWERQESKRSAAETWNGSERPSYYFFQSFHLWNILAWTKREKVAVNRWVDLALPDNLH